MAKNKELIFQVADEVEEKKAAMESRDVEDVALTDYEKQQLTGMKQEFFAQTGDGSVLQVRATSETGSEVEISMNDVKTASNFDTLDTVNFGDEGVRKISTNFDPERSEAIKAEVEKMKQDAYKEALGELSNNPKQVEDLDLALNHYYEIVRNRGHKLVNEFNEYVDKCSIDTLREDVPHVIFEIAADMQRMKFNPRSEMNKVRDFLKAMYQMTYGSFELEHYIENQQQLMDLATFSQDAGMSVQEFLSTDFNFEEIEAKIRHNLHMDADAPVNTFNRDVYRKLISYVTLKDAYQNLIDVCNHMDRLIDNLTVDELRSYIDDCYGNMIMIMNEQAELWANYDAVCGPRIKHMDPGGVIEREIINPSYNGDQYLTDIKRHRLETKERLEGVFTIYRPLLSLNENDDIKKIVNTLKTDISVGLFMSDDFDVEKAKQSINIKRNQMQHEVAFAEEYIQFLPKVMDLSFFRNAIESLKEKTAFVAKTKKVVQLEERALASLKELKKMNMKIAIAGLTDANLRSSVKTLYVDIKHRMETVYVDSSRFFMMEPEETRRIPKFDVRVLTAVYLIILEKLVEQMAMPLVQENKANNYDQRTLQLKFKVLESQIVEVTSFFAFSQMVEKDTVYELFVLMADYADEFSFKEKDLNILNVETVIAQDDQE